MAKSVGLDDENRIGRLGDLALHWFWLLENISAWSYIGHVRMTLLGI